MLAVAYRLVDLAIDSGSAPELLPVQQKSSSEGIRGKTLQMKLPEKLRELAKRSGTCRNPLWPDLSAREWAEPDWLFQLSSPESWQLGLPPSRS